MKGRKGAAARRGQPTTKLRCTRIALLEVYLKNSVLDTVLYRNCSTMYMDMSITVLRTMQGILAYTCSDHVNSRTRTVAGKIS